MRRGRLSLSLAISALALFSACGEPEEGTDLFEDASQPATLFDASTSFGDASFPAFDAGFPSFDAGNFADASSWSDSGSSSDAGTGGDASARSDAGAGDAGSLGGLGDIGGLGGLFGGGGDAGAPPDAGGNTGNPGKGELDPNGAINPNLPPKADNAKECPSLAPPNPVGNCLGLPIYLLCGYGKPGGAQLSCTCDWFHWICV